MKNMENKIVFVADIDDDIDDIIAVEYLAINGYLECLVLDGKSNNVERELRLKSLGVRIVEKIPEGSKVIFCGGAFTKIAEFVENNKIDLLVANGGFVGKNIVPETSILNKFKNKEKVRTYNLNMDIEASLKILNSDNIVELMFVSKNVCHNPKNVKGVLHKDDFLDEYELRDNKLLHDLLMVKEGVKYLNNGNLECEYLNVDLENEGSGVMTLWGSVLNENSKIKISVDYK